MSKSTGSSSGASSGSRKGKEPRVVEPEPEPGWWESCDPENFRQEFRMNRSTYNYIFSELDPFTVSKKKFTTGDFRRTVAGLIWKLASGKSNNEVEAKFGLTDQQCRLSVKKFVGSLMPKYVKWPEESEMANIKAEFETVSGIENIVGSMNTTRIQITKPNSQNVLTVDSYKDRQLMGRQRTASYSIGLQVVVNHKGVFTDIHVGEPGSLTDYHIYQRSPLSDRVLQQGDWIASTHKFPLTDEILAPYMDSENLTPTQRTFDYQLYRIESIAREACLRLKSRWLILQRKKDLPTLDTVVETVKACCILHNICAIQDDVISPRWRFDVEDNLINPEPPVVSEDASNRRDALAEDLQLRLNI